SVRLQLDDTCACSMCCPPFALYDIPLNLLFFFNATATTDIYTLSLHDALPILEIFQIGAASQSHMLAIVHMLAVGQHVGGCPAAEEGTLFKQTYAPAGFRQRDAGCQSRQPAADHDHALQGYSLPCVGRSAPWR